MNTLEQLNQQILNREKYAAPLIGLSSYAPTDKFDASIKLLNEIFILELEEQKRKLEERQRI